MKKEFLKYGNLAAFVAMIMVNVLAIFGLIGGVTTRDVSYMYYSLLTPADYAFSIWSVIYVLVAVMVFRQLKKDELGYELGYLFLVSCILNIGWIFAWQFRSMVLSFIIIVALLIDLIVLMKSVRKSDTVTKMAVGLYTGWINVAMLANLGAMFSKLDLKLLGMSGNASSVIGLIFGILWILYFLFEYSNIYYALGAAWGYFAISVASGLLGVQISAVAGMSLFIGSAIWIIIRKKMLT